MEKLVYRYSIVIGILSITAALVNIISYDAFNASNAGEHDIGGIPVELGIWRGKDMPLKDLIYELLETKSIIHRQYKADDGREVFLSIVYHAETKVNFHDPDQCLGAKGVALEKYIKTISFPNGNETIEINLNQLIQNQYGIQSLFYYFFKAGDFMGPNYLKLRLNLALNKFKNKKKSGSLIRISTHIPDNNTQNAANVLTDFLKELYPYLIIYL